MKDLTKGSPVKLMILFAVPIFIGNMFQQLYNLIDTVIVGQTLGVSALAAVGATSPIVNLIIGFAVGLTNGFAVIIARFFGANDIKQMKKAVAGTVILGIATGIVLTVLSLIFIRPLLKLLNTPTSVVENAYSFVRIIIIGIIFSVIYNMFAGILRALGDTKSPLYFLVISTIVNVILDYIFICSFNMGISGAAYATVLSQLLSAVLCYLYILKSYPILKLKKEDFKLNLSLIGELYTTGLSMGLMLSVVGVGTVVLQDAINGFGTSTIAAHTAARKISEFIMLPFSTLSLTVATFSSQNLGANKFDRIKIGIRQIILVSWICATVSVILSYTLAPALIAGITGTNKTEVINTAVKYLKINTPFYYILGVLVILRSTMQGIGQKIAPIIASFIELFGKVAAVYYLAPHYGYLGVCITEPITWIACSAFLMIVGVKTRGHREKLPIVA